jgi:uncharacterized protein YpmB
MKRFTATLSIMLLAVSGAFAQAKTQGAASLQDQKSAELSAQQMADLEEAKQLSARHTALPGG